MDHQNPSAGDPPILQLEGVGYEQDGVAILRGISWAVRRGEHWAVLGPNGSGKSTLLRVACGWVWPSSGRVLRLGEKFVDLGALRRSMGWIDSDLAARVPSADTALETVVTGRFGQIGRKRNLWFGPTEADWADARRELDHLACGHLADKPFGVLSQGEKQQVLVGRARMAGPLLLVLDEPTSGMDPGVRERFLAWLGERLAASDGPTVVLVTHHVEEIVPGVSRTLALRNGVVEACGPTPEVLTQEAYERLYETRLERLEWSSGRAWPIW